MASATLEVISGDSGEVNILAETDKVAPTFVHAFPAHSVGVLRVKTHSRKSKAV